MPDAGPPDVPGARHRTVTIATADAGPIDLHVLEAGDPGAPPVLMLHGWPQHAWCWHGVIPLLADDFRLIAPDLRGFGWSDCPEGGYHPATFAADAVALLDALEIDRVDVIGHDWGGTASFILGLDYPERVRRMVILNTIPPWVERSPALLAGMWRSWYAVVMAAVGDVILRRRPQMLVDGVRRDAVQPDGMSQEEAMAYAQRLREPARARASKMLYRSYLRIAARPMERGPLTVPTRFVFGANDGAIPPAALRGFESNGPDLTLEMVPDSGHFICEEKPGLIADRARTLFGE